MILIPGEYAGFDESEPTSRTGGKAIVIDTLKKKHNFKNLVHIGDGATDLEACPPADAFIGIFYRNNEIKKFLNTILFQVTAEMLSGNPLNQVPNGS